LTVFGFGVLGLGLNFNPTNQNDGYAGVLWEKRVGQVSIHGSVHVVFSVRFKM
jgi:hypothetical protein